MSRNVLRILAFAVMAIAFVTAAGSASASPVHRARLGARIEWSSMVTHEPLARAASTSLTDSWRPATDGAFSPLSDREAAAGVLPTAENRPDNRATNKYMPTAAQLRTFRSAVNNQDQSILDANPYNRFVTGHHTGTTDEIIQWAAQKWGIPTDVLRAQYVQESRWHMSQLGDLTTVTPAQYRLYPAQARVPGTDQVYESMGITQIKWTPDGSVGAGTEPLRWESTAFNIDYQAATIRFYFDDPGGARSAWGDSTYQAGQAWNSVGGWYEPYPWGNAGQLSYVHDVQAQLAERSWTQTDF